MWASFYTKKNIKSIEEVISKHSPEHESQLTNAYWSFD